MQSKRLPNELTVVLAIFTVALLAAGTRAVAQTETVLYSFSGNNGLFPRDRLIFDSVGNLYSTTVAGGGYGGGEVFELTPQTGGSWTEKVLHSFGTGKDGSSPSGSLVFDAAGNLYGTTYFGGAYAGGTVFEFTPTADGSWTEKVLHNFGSDNGGGFNPQAGVTLDAAGNLYGTTYQGGAAGLGTVFELTPTAGGKWTEKVLHSFGNGEDGALPDSELTFDAAGNLYGTTYQGGALSKGTVFELTPTAGGKWAERVLHNFGNGTDGFHPGGSLIFDAIGNVYGTTHDGGANAFGGVVFELTATASEDWKERILHSFNPNGTDGSYPRGGVIFDAVGNLYGTTETGGNGVGTVFELTKARGSWTENVLHRFSGTDGALPAASLVLDAAGNLYSTTEDGGAYSHGTVFEITP